MRISCSLTFHVNFKPLIIKIGWELDILCYIFWNSKIWRATFALFFFFFYFSVSFYPIWMKFLSKFRENVGLQAYHLGSVLNRSWTGLFRSFSKKLRGLGLLVRLNRLQSGPVLGPFPVLRTGPWSTNPRVWDPWRVEGGSVTTFHLSFLAPNMLSPHFSAATAQSVAPYVHHIFPSLSPRLYHEPSSINSMYNCNQILSRPLIGTNPYYLNPLSKTKLWMTDYYSWRVVWSRNKYAVILYVNLNLPTKMKFKIY